MKIVFLILALFFASIAIAQDPARYDAKINVGTAAFLDETIPFDHFVIGGSFNVHLNARFSIEPQILYMNGPESDRDIVVMGNVYYDLASVNRLTAYFTAGAGILNHSRRFGTSKFSANEFTGNAGIGVRINAGNNFFIAPEFRIGWEPLLSMQVAAGYSF